MRRSLRLACIVAALALATGAAAMVDALGADEPSATKVTAQERARQMRLEEARMQVEAAREAFTVADVRYKEGMGAHSDVAKAQLDIARAERALAEIEAEMEAMERRTITASVQNAPLQQAFAAIFGDSGESFTLHPDIAKLDYAVTLDLKDVSLESAVKVVCKLYNLEYETDNEGLWLIMPGSGFVTVAGARVPILGTVATVPGTQGGETAIRRGIRVAARSGARRVAETPERPSFPGEERLVDLDVKDAPLSEVASRLSFKAVLRPRPGDPLQDSWQNMNLEMRVDEAVKDVKVTARIAKWPVGEVLDMLLAQTGLVCTMEPNRGMVVRTARGATMSSRDGWHVPQDPVTGEVGYATIRIYLVPPPEMQVTGTPGIRLSGGGGAGFAAMVPAERPSFPGDTRLVDLDVKDAPLSEVASRLSFKAAPRPMGAPRSPDTWMNVTVEMVVDDAVKDLKVTAKIAKWPVGEVLNMLLAQTGLVCTVGPSAGTGPRTITRDPETGERGDLPAPTIRVFLVPAPELRVSGPGLPFETVVSQRFAIARRAKERADAVTALLALRECPKCHAATIRPDWKFCPKCGATLPEVKQPAEKGAKGD